jgi:transglutaminase-like putative cysteine protease
MAKSLNESQLYQFIYRNGLYPMLNSNVAKQIPVLVNDSFKAVGTVLPDGVDGAKLAGDMAKQLGKGNFKVIEYFNGVTLDEAIQSNDEIDAQARKIVGDETNTKTKAYLLYKWVSSNIKYDYDKARTITSSVKGTSSGSITAFKERKGICFDYSSLYISMCRAVGLKVRLVTGLGYSGISWGDHAWNQVYFEEKDRWINVDTTFGSAANYFDKPDFSVDHKYAEMQGEW